MKEIKGRKGGGGAGEGGQGGLRGVGGVGVQCMWGCVRERGVHTGRKASELV